AREHHPPPGADPPPEPRGQHAPPGPDHPRSLIVPLPRWEADSPGVVSGAGGGPALPRRAQSPGPAWLHPPLGRGERGEARLARSRPRGRRRSGRPGEPPAPRPCGGALSGGPCGGPAGPPPPGGPAPGTEVGGAGPGALPGADAFGTDAPGTWVGTRTADCVPILLSREAGPRVAAVHPGWRGTAGRMVEAGGAPLAREGTGPATL